MPARSRVSNRNKLRQAREAARALPPEQREELRWNGIGPGDSYIGIWRVANEYRRRVHEVQIGLSQPNIMAANKHELQKEWRYLMEQIIDIYSTILPFEKAKLAAVTLTGDQRSPVHVKCDLSSLSDSELHALARILPKLGGSTGPLPDKDEGGGGPRGDTAPDEAAPARNGRTGPRQIPRPADRSRRPA